MEISFLEDYIEISRLGFVSVASRLPANTLPVDSTVPPAQNRHEEECF